MTAERGRSIEVERRIDAPPELVFAYFTDPARYRLWQGIAARLDPRPGGGYEVDYTPRAGVRGRFLVVEPPVRLVFTWGWSGTVDLPPELADVAPGSSTIEVLFVRDGSGTIVRLRQSGLPTDGAAGIHGNAWSIYLERLGVAATGGDPGIDPVARGWT